MKLKKTFITNDFSAAVCMQTLKEYGVNMPDDIASAGFNNGFGYKKIIIEKKGVLLTY